MRFKKNLLIIFFVLILSVMAISCSGSSVIPATTTKASEAPASASIPPHGPTETPTPTVTTTPSVTGAPTSSPALAPSPSGTAIIARASQSILSVTSYRLQRTISTTKWATDSPSDEAVTTASGNMALDLSGQKMQMDNDINVVSPSGQPAVPPVQNSIYIINGTTYIMGLFPKQPQQWTKTSTQEAYWQLQDQSKQLVALLEASGASTLSPEAVNSGNLDVPCDVLVVTPDLGKFWALLAQQPGVQLPLAAPAGADFSQIVKSAAMKVWVAQASGLPIKAELSMSMQVGHAQVATLTRDVSMEISINILFYDYNQLVPIELPQEAQNAVELILTQAP